MTHFETFDSMDDLFSRMQTMHEAAMASLHPIQRSLLAAEEFHWMRPAPELDCVIFGYFNLADRLDEEQRYADEGDLGPSQDELRDRMQVRGYKTGRAYSVMCPEGELGDTHVANMWPITKAGFDQAKEMGWDVMGKVLPLSPLGRDFAAMYLALNDTKEEV